MNIEARKIQFIQEFLKLQNMEVVSHLEMFLKIETSSPIKRFSIDELNIRIDKSEEDFKEGRLIDNSDIKLKYL